MYCPHCKTSNPLGAANCSTCRAPLAASAATAVAELTPPVGSGEVTIVDGAAVPPYKPSEGTLDGLASSSMEIPAAWSVPATTQSLEEARASLAPLQTGSLLGHRYEIVAILGEGGMGAVYKARDVELDRMVALKVIRPELAGRSEILQRFKQELILARKVTHRNVIRIFDLGEAAGIKFITMEFIEGRDLKSILAQDGKLPPDRAVDIIQQVCLALEAAHSEGVVHRDLKPQNIMLDQQGRASVMDFGIARSLEFGGMTQTGALVGTPEYMSPEQVRGEHADVRSDLFTLGIIFQELLTGVLPYQAETAMASMFKRTKERAASVHHFNPEVPPLLGEIVAKCLEIQPQDRYQTAREVYDALEAWKSGAAAPIGNRSLRWVRRALRNRAALGIAAAVVLLLAGALLLRDRVSFLRPENRAVGAEMPSLAILPFRNASGDPSLDLGTSLAEMLSTDVGQSASLRTIPPDRLQQALHDLRVAPNSSLDLETIGVLAKSVNAQTVVWGSLTKLGDRVHIDATLQDLKRDHTAPLKVDAPNIDALPATIDSLAQTIRENLSVSSSVMKELQAEAFKPTSKSLPALRYYNEGVDLGRGGRHLEAVKRFEAATKEDPQFALAYAKLSQSYSILGYDNEAEQASRKAVELSQNLPVPERYRIAAIHSWIVKDYSKAIEGYENLAKVAPEDTEVQSALGELYVETLVFDKARALYGRLLERDPKSMRALFGMGQVETMSGNPETALDYLNRALTIAIQLENDEEKALVLHFVGVAYRKLNKPDEALRNFQESLAITRRLGEKAAIAQTLNEMGQLLYGVGKSDDALKNYQEASKLRHDIGDKKGTGDTLIDLGNLYYERGDFDQALQRYQESLQIQRDLGDEFSQAICLNNIGGVYFTRGDYQEALTFLQQALQLREKLGVPTEIAQTVQNLGDTTLKLGQFDQALVQYMRALKLYRSAGDKRKAATVIYSTVSVFEYQGRYSAALNAEEEALKVFRELQDHGSDMGDIVSGYGNVLTLVGRGGEGQKYFDEALSIAREIKSDPLIAQIKNYEGDRFFYSGDLKSARSQYEEAIRIASHTSDREKALVAKINLAKVAVGEGRSGEAISALKTLTEQADVLGLKYLSAECSVYLAQALISTKNYTAAQQELQRSLDRSEKLGMRILVSKSHYLLATALRLTGNSAEAAGHYQEAVRLLDEVGKEPGVDKVLERADLKSIYQDFGRWSQAAKR